MAPRTSKPASNSNWDEIRLLMISLLQEKRLSSSGPEWRRSFLTVAAAIFSFRSIPTSMDYSLDRQPLPGTIFVEPDALP
jgi:hypothetical protein